MTALINPPDHRASGVLVKIVILLNCLMFFITAGTTSVTADENLTTDMTRTRVGQATGTSNFNTSIFTEAGTYSYSFDDPPGRLGLSPDLILNYSSSGGDGITGVGWQISTSYIQRSKKYGLDYDGDDFVYIESGNAQELVYVGDAGSLGYEYRMKNESGRFLRIFRRAFDPVGDYEWYWVVLDKDGTRYTFDGCYAPSMVGPGDTPTPRLPIYRWLLTRVEDSNSNYMTIQYDGYDELKISLISYTGNSTTSLQPTNQIEFSYSARPYPYRTFEARGYYGIEHNEILTQITMRAGGNLVSRYVLGYTTSPNTNRPLLTSITRYGDDNTSTRPPTEFKYSADVDTEGLFDHMTWDALTGYSFAGDNDKYKWLAADFNNDGKTDLIHFDDYDHGHLWWGFMEVGIPFIPGISIPSPGSPDYNLSHHDDLYHFVPADFNKDGIMDLIHFVSRYYFRIWIGEGNGWFEIQPRWPEDDDPPIPYEWISEVDNHYSWLIGNFDDDYGNDMVHPWDCQYNMVDRQCLQCAPSEESGQIRAAT